MAYIETPDPASAPEDLAALYRADIERSGYLPNYAKLFGVRPSLYAIWKQLAKEVFDNLGARNYELATLGAARAMRSSYCSLAHGDILATKFFDPETVIAIGAEGDADELSQADQALIRYAAKVASDAASITTSDIDELRSNGFDDVTIFDIASAAAARAFFSKMLDALGAEPDFAYREMDQRLRDALTVGRPIEAAEVSGP